MYARTIGVCFLFSVLSVAPTGVYFARLETANRIESGNSPS